MPVMYSLPLQNLSLTIGLTPKSALALAFSPSHDSQAQFEGAVYTSPHRLHHASPYDLPPLTLTPPCKNARQAGAGGQAGNDHGGGLGGNEPGGCRLALFQGSQHPAASSPASSSASPLPPATYASSVSSVTSTTDRP
mmetsp:Transcript_35298/g.51870  ORF Transcript_35298/g.51870 Transcript_35298/m.51870 type:complete len:138 (+) Transcript_35298:214-627(+)